MLIFVLLQVVLIAANDSNTCAKKNGTITNVFSNVGSTIVLECYMNNFDSVPSWYRQGVALSDGNTIYKSDKRFKIVEGLGGNRFNLQISTLMKADEDKYCCNYIYQYKSIENCTLLHLVDISIIPNESKVITRLEGSNITLSCLFPSNVPGLKTISWISNGTIQNAKDTNILNRTVLLTLDLHGQNQSCRGFVHCMNMSFEKVIQFNVTYSPKVKVNMIPSSLLKESDQVRLTCVYDSNPAPSVIIWTHNDVIIHSDFEYYIHNISRREDGVYQCKVKNAIGYGFDEIKLRVQYAPEAHVELLPNSSLLCTATGFPNNYTFSNWEHLSIDGHSLRLINNATNLLKFDFNNGDDNPIYTFDGLYVCKVSNGIPDEHNITMQRGFSDVYFPGKPYCIPQNKSTEIRERTEPVTITFIVYSRTPVNYTWQKGRFQLKGSSKYEYQIHQTSTPVKMHGVIVNLTTLTVGLLIYSLTDTDFDSYYTVYLSNKYGNSSCSKDLLEGSLTNIFKANSRASYDEIFYHDEKTSTIDNLKFKLTVKPLLVSFEVNWNSGFNGRYPQSFTINYRSIMDQNWTTIAISFNERQIKIQGLLENMKYLVYMYALNVIGKSDNTDNVTIQTLESHTIYFPQEPTEFGIKLYKKSFLVNWISGFDGGFPQKFVIKYRFVEDETWSVHRSDKQTCTSERICELLIKAVLKYGHYVFYMYAENKLGKSSNTKPVTIEINTFTKENQERENHIFSRMTDKLLISLTLTLLVIVIVISCCVFGRQYRINRINAPSFSNQASTSNAAIRNGHYEEIDAALEINVSNSLSPGNYQIENLEMREATQISMPTSIQTIQEIAEQTMRDMSMRVLTETTATEFRENHLKLIKETVRQVLSENYDLQPNSTHSTSSTESEHDTNDENGYLNPYQPLNINVDSCEHPYTDTTLKDDTPNNRETKNCSIGTLSFQSENATFEL